ncbi:MAG TPA: hypothetical protein VN806_13000 [Caulobacteraceae bacterium]|nr:hypothetical protein [Caulobacteraceae bacterium]
MTRSLRRRLEKLDGAEAGQQPMAAFVDAPGHLNREQWLKWRRTGVYPTLNARGETYAEWAARCWPAGRFEAITAAADGDGPWS